MSKHALRAVAMALVAGTTLVTAPGAAAASAPSAAVATSAADAPIELTLEATPSCVRLGGTIQVTVGIKNTTLRLQKFFLVFEAKYNGIALPIEIPVPGSDEPIANGDPVGPLFLPPKFGLTQTVPIELPRLVLPGRYTVEVSVGPSAVDPTSYDAESESVNVSLICLPLGATGRTSTAE